MIVITSLTCLALNTYKEARSTSFNEQVAVTSTVLNRSKDEDYCKVVFAKKQYSWTSNVKLRYKFKNLLDMLTYYKIDDIKAFYVATNAAIIAKSGIMNNGETHYYDKSISGTKWAKDMFLVNSTQNFMFYKNV